MSLRAQLAVNGARQALLSHWRRAQPNELQGVLAELTHDERVMAAGACSADLIPLTQTKTYPRLFTCIAVGGHLRPIQGVLASDWMSWTNVVALPEGDAHLSAIPVLDGEQALGFVVLVHDLSFVQRREATSRRFLLFAFGFIAVVAAVVTIVTARLSWHRRSDELRGVPRSGRPRPDSQPLLRDVRERSRDRLTGRLTDHLAAGLSQ